MQIIIVKTPEQREVAFRIRHKVFIVEQNVPPEEEMDEFDETATHFVGYADGNPAAASRLRLVDDYGKLERIAVLKEYRGNSYGKQIIQAMEDFIKQHKLPKAKLNAQTHAENFYKKLGYETISDTFMDAGIPHVTMIKHL
ncbi:putative N-acetyltransferase YjcF [Lentibacillus sp. JNUCC-1]|uniref:GNAT family N-acetyltransferase n=1 Tax=Lentibacillus sp. JNUCC-1 TaxID=2654513 RepID=UPI0012E71845|nr:GNAT family N-acetyltransferase [Lentibacillus sp. JNUCC-1]MUV36498.1 putative N-acetyltransferase YjcF [Lentibacillus sp. JNUCC-1]